MKVHCVLIAACPDRDVDSLFSGVAVFQDRARAEANVAEEIEAWGGEVEQIEEDVWVSDDASFGIRIVETEVR